MNKNKTPAQQEFVLTVQGSPPGIANEVSNPGLQYRMPYGQYHKFLHPFCYNAVCPTGNDADGDVILFCYEQKQNTCAAGVCFDGAGVSPGDRERSEQSRFTIPYALRAMILVGMPIQSIIPNALRAITCSRHFASAYTPCPMLHAPRSQPERSEGKGGTNKTLQTISNKKIL